MKPLTSPKNPELLDAARLLQPSHRKESGLFLIEGLKLVREARETGLEIQKIFVTEACARQDPALCRDLEEAVPTYLLPASLLAKVSSLETPEGIVAVGVQRWSTPAGTADRLKSAAHAFGVVSDGLQDPGNLGSLLRTARAFGASFAFIATGGVSPYQPKALRASMGAAFRLILLEGDALQLESLVNLTGADLITTSPREGKDLQEFVFPKRFGVVFGSEAHGVSRAVTELSSHSVRIPIADVESLGVAVSAGIILYEASRRRPASK